MLVISLSLYTLAGNPALLQQYNNGENIIFRDSNFTNPSASELFNIIRNKQNELLTLRLSLLE
ncbi:MAG: hypothetical protein HY738_22970 [Bacteroidia bacterium]|nr:hypothetical protein [Bacteroidia bacterium]